MPGPRIYNLFPLLAGPVPQWSDHLERIAAMAFDWVYVNPFHYPGFSGSLYAIKDYYRLHPLLAADGADPQSLLKGFTKAAAKRRIAVMMDLVINHTAKDSVLVAEHPEWFRRDAGWRAALAARDRSGRSAQVHRVGRPRRDRLRQSEHAPGADRVLGGAGQAPPEARLQGVPLRCRLPGAGRGVAADRCEQAKALDPDVPLLRRDARLHAGSRCWRCARAGFDYLFNSAKWWDFRAPWLLEQYDLYRQVAPTVAFPGEPRYRAPRDRARRPRAAGAGATLPPALSVRGRVLERRDDADGLRVRLPHAASTWCELAPGRLGVGDGASRGSTSPGSSPRSTA